MADIPPWLDVRPAQFVQAAGAGAQAGLEAGGQFQRGQIAGAQIAQETARTALAAQAQKDRVAMEAAQLNQQAVIAQMETQARKDIAEKQAVRQSQEIALQNAYHQAQIGLHARDLQRQEMVADQKMQEAAMAHQDQQGFAQAVASGMSVADALFRFPHTPHSIVSSLGGQYQKDYGDFLVHDVPGFGKVGYRQFSPGAHVLKSGVESGQRAIERGDEAEYNEIRKRLLIPDQDASTVAKLNARRLELEKGFRARGEAAAAPPTQTGTQAPPPPPVTGAKLPRFKDKSGTTWEYLGSGDPMKDKDQTHWRPVNATP